MLKDFQLMLIGVDDWLIVVTIPDPVTVPLGGAAIAKLLPAKFAIP